MSQATNPTWEQAASPDAARLARRFEAAWRSASPAGPRPDPRDFLADGADPGDRLALLRAAITLRWEEGDHSPIEDDLARFPELDDDTRVALVYEEFCLREEDGEHPAPASYHARFPQLSARLRRLLDIHDLVGSAPSMSLGAAFAPAATAPLPEVGQTIGPFRLVEELGRGSFARVFRAQESTLADRPVALKVSRAASREPQALARLQHTHIVPVHSYQTDAETGLHLLCMPYFGRVTLARVLADPTVRVAKAGAEIVSALDRLDPAGVLLSERPAGRRELASRPYPRAIAWWGARLAEALQQAHDRGVLHRDVKPSNVLITGDGMPMLLDFNLAWESWLDETDPSPSALGGTLAYMAPEHLEALADGGGDGVDGKADIYSLGVVLYEAVGARPFASPSGAFSLTDTLLRAAEDRRRGPTRLRATYPDVPAELEAVIRRCLEPDPGRRYAHASELAEDLQAIADDDALPHAREPWPGRGLRWVRRHRRHFAVVAPLLLVAMIGAYRFSEMRRESGQRRDDTSLLLREGRAAMESGRFEEATARFNLATRSAANDRAQEDLSDLARQYQFQSKERLKAADKVRALEGHLDRLRLSLLDDADPHLSLDAEVRDALKPFFVFANDDWARLGEWDFLDQATRARLFTEVDDLLFLWSVSLARPSAADPRRIAQALVNCRKAPGFSTGSVPWVALHAQLVARADHRPPSPLPDVQGARVSAADNFRLGLLHRLDGNIPAALSRLRDAADLRPGEFWYHLTLADTLSRAGQPHAALDHFGDAIALAPRSSTPYLRRARLLRLRGEFARALRDVERARECEGDRPSPEVLDEEAMILRCVAGIFGA